MDTRQQKLYDDIKRRLTAMETRRYEYERVWQRAAELADPKNANFTVEYGPGGFNKGTKKTDNTVAQAVPKWASAIDGLTTPKTQKWHGLATSDEYLNDRYADWLERQCDKLFSIRYGAGSNFANAHYENLKNIAIYGAGPFSVTEKYGYGISYRAWPVREFYTEQNAEGEVDVFFRKFKLNKRQALQQFGQNCPKQIIISDDLSSEWEFLHAVYPNDDYQPRRLDPTHRRYASVYVCLSTSEIVEESGYNVCPFFYPRYDVFASLQEPYGYSPVMQLMPEVRTLAAMMRTNLKTAQRASDPTWLLANDDIINAARVGVPNAIIPGGLNENGQPLVAPMQGPNALPFSLEMLQDIRNTIKEGFELNLFTVLVNRPDMTATEVLQRAQETATLLSPTTSRLEQELLSGVIAKELEICTRAGQLEPMPPEMAEALASGQVALQVRYESPIRKAQDAGTGAAILRTVELAGALQPFDPSIKNLINAPRILKEIAKVYGAPAKIFNTEEEKAAADLSDAQLAQAQAMLQAAPVIGKTAKDLADAQQKTGTQVR